MKRDFKFREIPYNYTSFSDREIILKYFDDETWSIINTLRQRRKTGRSAKLLFENLGDIFIIDRNPYIFNDLLENKKKLKKLRKQHQQRLSVIERGANDEELVTDLLERVRTIEDEFFENFRHERRKRLKIGLTLKTITRTENIQFTAFHKVSHATDATDWRVEYPAVVVYPDSIQEIRSLVKAARRLELHIIPRGGGTGLTGGAVPLDRNTMVINTEKLTGINPIHNIMDLGREIPAIEVEAGVVTDDVIHYCQQRGFIFATDPTSAWASTIGGNIAENAGGKKCVMWGTCIDNLLSYRLVDSDGNLLEIRRIHHPYRKILENDIITFEVYRIHPAKGKTHLRTIELNGTDIRKKGLGKDITNKALGGVPGIQKEGGDGIIVSATFVLYRPFTHCRTICLEFFGNNMVHASKAIVDIMDRFSSNDTVYLTALEHFDEKYVKAIQYRNKSRRTEIPKAVLLIDIESNDEDKLDNSCKTMISMVQQYNTEGMIASDSSARERFWKDRKNLGAIARHTNAFKLNEDIVIPLEKIPDFADFIEKLNVKKELANYTAIINDIEAFLSKAENFGDDEFIGGKISDYLNNLKPLSKTYYDYACNLDTTAREFFKYDSSYSSDARSLFQLLQEEQVTLNFKTNVVDVFHSIFHGYAQLLLEFDELVGAQQNRRIIIATHMHAGDGNVHVNIPVHSNDYAMMREADTTAGIIMEKVVELGGVISGEHGIGLTKLRFIDQQTLDSYASYKKLADPDNMFNPGKLSSHLNLDNIYTPSFNLLELEAFILKATDLEKLSTSIASCVRCGKCKGVCNTHYPGGTMFFNPRNKILGTALIMEAVLYDIQTSNTLSFRNFKKLREITDHCTICHNCQVPCPVNIDFGDITLEARALLVHRKKSRFKPVTTFTLFYLKQKGYYMNKLFRILILKLGYRAQRIGYYVNRPVSALTSRIVPLIAGYLKGKFPVSGARSLRERLGLSKRTAFITFQKPGITIKKSVIYFPGCGSERMFPEISIATVALLYNAGIRVVIPPEYLCCGYPMQANGKISDAEIKINENRVIFHRMADIISYMDIDGIILTCGTCYEMLSKYELENVFQDASLYDVNEYIAYHNLYRSDINSLSLLYHEPCHSPLKHSGYENTFHSIFNNNPTCIPNCCGEGGTLALSTPDIANTLRERKKENLLVTEPRDHNITILTTCPSCVQGLTRIDGTVSVKGKSLVVYCAEQFLGQNWQKEFLREVKKGGYETILF